MLIAPHVDRERDLRRVLGELGLDDESIVLRSTAGTADDDAALVARAWDLDHLAEMYDAFNSVHAVHRPPDAEGSFRAVVELVHSWRRFPFTDPELPTDLLPENWPGATAADVFRDRHADLSPAARSWFGGLEAESSATP